jgi:ATP-dependent Clp protease adaptor protein ClpS
MTMHRITSAERRDGDDADTRTGVGVATRTRSKTKQPTPYRVLMLNDDYTPMEFVVLCLQRFFRWTWRPPPG